MYNQLVGFNLSSFGQGGLLKMAADAQLPGGKAEIPVDTSVVNSRGLGSLAGSSWLAGDTLRQAILDNHDWDKDLDKKIVRPYGNKMRSRMRDIASNIFNSSDPFNSARRAAKPLRDLNTLRVIRNKRWIDKLISNDAFDPARVTGNFLGKRGPGLVGRAAGVGLGAYGLGSIINALAAKQNPQTKT